MLALFSRGAALVRELETRDSLFLVGPKREDHAHISHSVLFLKHIVALCAGGGCLCPLSNSFFTGQTQNNENRTRVIFISSHILSFIFFSFFVVSLCETRESSVVFPYVWVSVYIYTNYKGLKSIYVCRRDILCCSSRENGSRRKENGGTRKKREEEIVSSGEEQQHPSPEEMRKTFCGSECLLLLFFSLYIPTGNCTRWTGTIERKEEG